MRISKDLSLNQVSWIKFYSDAPVIRNLYEPESVVELRDLCRRFYNEGRAFDIIGHTTNTYFLSNKVYENIISTRRLTSYSIKDNEICCECGVNVAALSRKMVHLGISGFEGLINLPGTIGAAVYGNSSSYGCSINAIIKSVRVLLSNGNEIEVDLEWLQLEHRSTCLKRGEQQGVILSVTLRRNNSNKDTLVNIARLNQDDRRLTQPTPLNNLGSIFTASRKLTMQGFFIKSVVKLCCIFQIVFKSQKISHNTKLKLELKLLGALELLPYMHSWNRFIWSDENAHKQFWRYVEIHHKLYKDHTFEIEIKG